ncbi:calmodulin-binding receptor-like cytoplasmic kinase 2 isoform X1 [Solanum pennellii]|uniref:Calmodulin-binding receptor-like cytoplasmic kinase 2 isoform X1 n=2 Tax=Solanum pennellii TaxID=28526 RepID=A0ABM1FVF3_SOLPN|nr:calmodulin-binding receptor-like cytoplasmic kinase 2 isoform X1 [Solanum pennellii]
MIFAKILESEQRNVIVGIRFDGHIRELLNWAIVKVAEPGDRVIALHVCRNAESIANVKSSLDTYLYDYDGLCNKKQVDLISLVTEGSSTRRVLVREAKNHDALAVIVGNCKHSTLGGWTSIAKYCAKKLPTTTEVMAIDNGKVLFRRTSTSQLKGSFSDPKPSLYLERISTAKDCESEFGESEISEFGRFSCEVTRTLERWTNGTQNIKEENTSTSGKHKKGSLSLGSISLPTEDCAAVTTTTPGWPLLQTTSSLNEPAKVKRKMSVVQWVMTLPNRSMLDSPKSNSSPKESQNAFGMENSYSLMDFIEKESASVGSQLIKDYFGCKWFSYDVIRSSTSNFSSEKLIGKGGENSVYKAVLPDGKSVAVKVLNSSDEARKNFRQEMDIMTRVEHKNIAHVLGICIQDSDLISVYDFHSKGNLEENIHGRTKSVLPWERRFRIAVGTAEALNYLHNECRRPVIHRDVKSSNILLNDDFEPQLSDFGLAIWGPTKASFLTHSDVVGTFGYLAPEYFMYGKVSDKIDVYSFGVVLLELLSGRKAIGFETPSGQESLVMWAKPKLESRNYNAILDENLNVNIEDDQVQRMILAARLCLTQAARLRPNISQILKMLKGEKDGNEEVIARNNNTEEYNDDEVYPDSSAESHLSLAFLDVNYDNSTCFSSSQDQSSPLSSVDEYLRKRWSRSSSSEY